MEKELVYETKNVFSQVDDAEKQAIFSFCDDYRKYLDLGKTERECVSISEEMAIAAGFKKLEERKVLKAGDKVYSINRDKNILLAIIGKRDITEGFKLIGSHIDAPRLDLKQNPLYEKDEMALFKTHYYGGIKKYQWATIPLAIHGVIFTKDGEKVNITVGEDESDPVFCITDLLPHLDRDQANKKMDQAIAGEDLNVVVGGVPCEGEDKEAIKLNILKLLNAKYNICERDFLSAELEVVPAFRAKNVGFDGAFVGAYGQDDRVCAYTSLKAILDADSVEKTAICLLVDKEEVGSMGNTGFRSAYFEMTVAELISKIKGSCDMLTFNRTMSNSECLSSDVSAAVDPNYESAFEMKNSTYAGRGISLVKYTGARGKSGASDANAEFLNKMIRLFDENGVIWQSGELGKVDQGGGGTIAQYVANLNMEVLDCGVAVVSMHSPFELTAKADVYMTYKACSVFYRSN